MRENTTQEIATAYRALRIPSDHILLFDGPAMATANGPNPYHGSTIRQPGYAPQWRTLFGAAGSTASVAAPLASLEISQ